MLDTFYLWLYDRTLQPAPRSIVQWQLKRWQLRAQWEPVPCIFLSVRVWLVWCMIAIYALWCLSFEHFKQLIDHMRQGCALSILIVDTTQTIFPTPIWDRGPPLCPNSLLHPSARIRVGSVRDNTKEVSPLLEWSASQRRSLSSF